VVDQQDLRNRTIPAAGLSPHHYHQRDQVLQEVTLIMVVAILLMTMITEGIREMFRQKIGAGISADKNANNEQKFEPALLPDSLNNRAIRSVLNLLLHQTPVKVTEKTLNVL
jgi:hypothetical protein